MGEENTKSAMIILLHNAAIVTMDSQSRVFQNGGIVIENDRIKAIGQSSSVLQQFSALAHQIIDLNGQILLPGPFSCSLCLIDCLNLRLSVNQFLKRQLLKWV